MYAMPYAMPHPIYMSIIRNTFLNGKPKVSSVWLSIYNDFFTLQYICMQEKRMVYLDPLGVGLKSEEAFRAARYVTIQCY